jgi:hypothetical protein
MSWIPYWKTKDKKITLREVDDRLTKLKKQSDFPHNPDAMSHGEWIAYIVKHLGASTAINNEAFPNEMLNVAAMAMAAIDWHESCWMVED